MRILLSAYSCEPGKGSEPEVGLQALATAASLGDVWLLTRANNVDSIKGWLSAQSLLGRVHVKGFDVPGVPLRAKEWGLPGLHWYYDLWQRHAGAQAVALDEQVRFDLVHHATFATYWARFGTSIVDRPLVWGPVGGGVSVPWRLTPALGLAGTIEDTARHATRGLLGRSPWIKEAARNSRVILVQNSETASALPKTNASIRIFPNATSASVEPWILPRREERNRDVLLVGRLVAWKGGAIAIQALAAMRNRVQMKVYGDGPDRGRLGRIARRFGVEGQVRFMGHVDRSTLISAVAGAGCVVHPSLHDDSPLGAAEALSVGAPLVGLRRGGLVEIVRQWPASPTALVEPGSLRSTAGLLAREIDRFLDSPPPIPRRVLNSKVRFADALLDAYKTAGSS